jgi:hypothetical protein
MRRFTNSRRTLVGLVLMATLGIAACSANHAPSAAGSGNGHSTIPTATAICGSAQPPARQRTDDHLTAPPAPAAPTPTSGTSLVPMQTAQGGEFVSPSGNISCEVDYNRDGVTAAYCETGTPPQSVTMGVTGSYTTCTGVLCLSNPGMDTPTLAYGAVTGVGPFVCESATTGVTCTADGRGFQISRSGITPV